MPANRIGVLLILLGLTQVPCLAAPGLAAADMKQIPVVRLESSTDVAAAPAAVWSWITSGRNLVTWCPVWKSPANAKLSLTKVGDVLDYTDEWGNGGRSVVTYFVPNKELRVAHDPNDGSYMCQARLLLAPAGSGTHVTWVEQYTDESAADALKATSDKMQAEIGKTLGALKAAVEAKK